MKTIKWFGQSAWFFLWKWCDSAQGSQLRALLRGLAGPR